MSEHTNPDAPEEIGGVPVDEELGDLPPVDDEPVEARIPRKQKFPIPPKKDKARSRWPFLLVGGCLLFCCLCWLACCIIAVAFGGAAAVMANNEVSQAGTLQRTIEADPDAVISLAVDNSIGQVHIRPGDSGEVKVDYTKKAFGFTEGQAQNGLDAITVTLENTGGADQFTITTNKDGSPLHFLDHVNMTVYVPSDVRLNIKTNTGEIDVQNVKVHAMDLRADTGAITFEGTLEPDADARFNIETSTGAIIVRLPNTAYVSLDAKTDTGSVDVARDFRNVSVERDDNSGLGESWRGLLGEGQDTAPKLTLRSNTGAIMVETQ